jgi:hypothetical protein
MKRFLPAVLNFHSNLTKGAFDAALRRRAGAPRGHFILYGKNTCQAAGVVIKKNARRASSDGLTEVDEIA